MRRKPQSRRDNFVLEDSFAYVIYRGARLLRSNFGRLAERLGLEVGQEQFFILNKLADRPQQAQHELSSPFADRPNIARMIASMESSEWLQRQPDPTDGRKLLVSLTPLGHRILLRLREAAIEERRRVFSGLNGADLDGLRRIIGVIERNLADSEPSEGKGRAE